MFNDIEISRKTGNTTTQQMKVPINYAPMQKILARINQDPQLNAPAITLPRMSFEMTGMTYAPDRKLTSVTKLVKSGGADGDMTSMFAPAPYDIEFQLNVMTKYNEDGTKIIEQILPFFKPDCTVSVKLIDELGTYFDIPIVLNSVSQEDTYEGDFETRRALIWTLNFTMKGYFFGPVSTKKQITFVDVDVAPVAEFADGQPGNVEASQISVSSSAHVFSPFTFTTAENGDVSYTHNLVPGEQYRVLRVGLSIGGPDAFEDPSFPAADTTNYHGWQKGWQVYMKGRFHPNSPDETEDTDESDTWSVGDTFTAPDLDALLSTIVSGSSHHTYSHLWSGEELKTFKSRMEHALVTKVQVASYDPDATELDLGTDDDWKYRTIVT
jgi:hypothetical protein